MKNVTIDPSIRELIGKSRPEGLAFSIAGPVTGRTSVSELRASAQASVCAVSSERTKCQTLGDVTSATFLLDQLLTKLLIYKLVITKNGHFIT
jgi:hypothetical protein